MIYIKDENSVPPGGGFIWNDPETGTVFKKHYISGLRDMVVKFHAANGRKFSEEDFIRNVCIHTPGDICSERLRGLGDVVALIANPIAKTLDAVAQTNISGCGGCAQRQAALNKAVPFQ